jgi:hypothetical protein
MPLVLRALRACRELLKAKYKHFFDQSRSMRDRFFSIRDRVTDLAAYAPDFMQLISQHTRPILQTVKRDCDH